RHTRFSRDWSSDVCSSDLYSTANNGNVPAEQGGGFWSSGFGKFLGGAIDAVAPGNIFHSDTGEWAPWQYTLASAIGSAVGLGDRSEERRVGKACRSRWWQY